MIFERVTRDEVNRAVSVARGSAGKSVNVAKVLRTLGDDVMACLPLGGDTGRFIGADLDRLGIPRDTVEIAAPTRTCVTFIERGAGTATELVEESGPMSAEESAAMLARFRANLPRSRMVILSGKLAPSVGEDFYAECCRSAGELGVRVILDGRGGPLLRALSLRPMVVKPNRGELAETLGMKIADESSLKDAMVSLHKLGAQWVVVTMGREGAVIGDGKSFWKIPSLEIEVVSAIGSGDAFAAGLASAIAAGREVPDACRLAAACAAANALLPGAGNLRIEDVRRLEPLARVERW
jgi:tagatose 6-phosphate kinase